MVLNKIQYTLLVTGLLLFTSIKLTGQVNNCGANAIAVNASCVTTNYNIASTFTNSGTGTLSCGVTSFRDGWFTFTATSTSTTITVTNTNRSMAFAVYTGGCGSPTEVACVDNFNGSPTTETTTITTLIGTVYGVRIMRVNNAGINDMNGTICVFNAPVGAGHNIGTGNLNACSGTLYDTGGSSGAYSNNETITETYCSNSSNCISVTFNTFSTESCCDDLTIYDGPTTGSPLIGVYAGTSLAGQTIQSTTGCLTFVWDSDFSNTSAGWDATISCSACPTCIDGIQNGTETGIDCGGTTCPPCPCSDVTIAALPYTVSGATTSGFGDDFDSGDACGSIYMNGDDIVYSYTPTVNQSLNINLTNASTTFTGLFVLDNCPDAVGANCISSNTGSATLSVSCLNVIAGNTYYIVVSTWPAPQTVTYDLSITVNAGGSPTCGLNYSYSTIAYNAASYTTGNLISFSDDRFASAYTSIGFDFCYDGVIYQDVLVSSNGYIVFPGCYSAHPFGTAVAPSGYSEYAINAIVPNTTNAPVNAIMGTWQDIYPSTLAIDGEIRTQTTGAAPNRRFKVSFYDVRMYSCTGDDYNGQIFLRETSDNIEVHLGEKTVCTGFNGGAAVMGITDYTGTLANIPAGYNYPTQWTVPTGSPEGHQWTSNCGVCTVLPVKLVDFKGNDYDNHNLITWRTETEVNNDYFVLERSNGGATFYEVATIDGAGNSNNMLEYSYRHNNPQEVEYYRLRQVDFDGKVAYSKIIVVRREDNVNVNLFPNPTNNNLYFEINESNDAVYTVKYATITGSIAEEEIVISKGTNKYKLALFNTLKQGIYFINITDEQGNTIKIDKIIKK